LLIPGILHLENRVGEKIVTTIVRKGFELYGGSVTNFVKILQEVLQTQVLE